jgi:hypothetical protein
VDHDRHACGLHKARGKNETHAQTCPQQFGAPSPLQVAENQTPDHAQRQPVEQQEKAVPGIGGEGETDESQPGNPGEDHDGPRSSVWTHLGHHLDPDEFGDEIAKSLQQNE